MAKVATPDTTASSSTKTTVATIGSKSKTSSNATSKRKATTSTSRLRTQQQQQPHHHHHRIVEATVHVVVTDPTIIVTEPIAVTTTKTSCTTVPKTINNEITSLTKASVIVDNNENDIDVADDVNDTSSLVDNEDDEDDSIQQHDVVAGSADTDDSYLPTDDDDAENDVTVVETEEEIPNSSGRHDGSDIFLRKKSTTILKTTITTTTTTTTLLSKQPPIPLPQPLSVLSQHHQHHPQPHLHHSYHHHHHHHHNRSSGSGGGGKRPPKHPPTSFQYHYDHQKRQVLIVLEKYKQSYPKYHRFITSLLYLIFAGYFVYWVGCTVFWCFHHIQCYSRELGVVWDEGISHTLHNRTCPKPIYYTDDTTTTTTSINNNNNIASSSSSSSYLYHQDNETILQQRILQHDNNIKFLYTIYANKIHNDNNNEFDSTSTTVNNNNRQYEHNQPHQQEQTQSKRYYDPSRICITSLSDAPITTDDYNQDEDSSIFSWFFRYRPSLRCRDFTNILEYTWPITQRYCNKHGYTCYESSYLLDHSRPPAWSKIKAVFYLLTGQSITLSTSSANFKMQKRNRRQQQAMVTASPPVCDWVLWMDADTIIMNSDIRIEDLLPIDASLSMTIPNDNASGKGNVDDNEINLIVTYDRRFTANSGVWLLRNSKWSQQFLQNWWNMKRFVRQKGFSLSGDNEAMGYLIENTYGIRRMKQQVLVDINSLKNKDKNNKNKNIRKDIKYDLQSLDMSNQIRTGPIRMIPRCQMNAFGAFVVQKSPNKVYMEHVGSDKYYHGGDFIAHASGIDQKEAGIQLLIQRAV